MKQTVEISVLEFKEDGVYLNDRRLDYITDFSLESDARLHMGISKLSVTGVRTDPTGEFVTDESGALEGYDIKQYVTVKGLDYKKD